MYSFYGCLSIGDPECQNGGQCSNGVCFCPFLYTGSTCEECKFWSCAISLVNRHCLVWLLLPCAASGLVDLQIPGLPNICQFNYCFNGGSCVEDTIRNTSYCDCPDGYEGANCESATCKSVIWSIGYMYETYLRMVFTALYRYSFPTDTDTLQYPSVLCCFSSLCSVGNVTCSEVGGVCNAGQCECFCGWTGEYCDIRGRKKIDRVVGCITYVCSIWM